MSRPDDQRLDQLLATSHDALWLWQIRPDQIRLGSPWRKMLGIADDTVLKPGIDEWLDRIHPDEKPRVNQALQQHISGVSPLLECEHRLEHEDGSWRWVLLRGRCLHDGTGQPLELVGSFTDITAQKVLDPYTRLPNRILFLDRLERSLGRLRHAPNHIVAALNLRIHLSQGYTELLGRDQLSQLARTIGERIAAEVRPWDLVAQFGELEFAVLLEMVTSTDDLPAIFKRLIAALRKPVQVDDNLISLQVALGGADSTVISTNEEQLLRAAESAAALAQEHGSNQYVHYDPATQDQLSRRLRFESELLRAIEDSAFDAYFQPILNLADGSLHGFEALVRWQRAGSMVSPDDFIPILERQGLISQLTWIMLQKSLVRHEEWLAAGLVPSSSRVSVNFPPEQLQDPALVGLLRIMLDNVRVPTCRLKVEITERSLVSDSGLVQQTLQALHAAGIEVALDDFGTGYSSLSMLHRFELDNLKIDRSFVSELEHSEQAGSITRAIVGLAASSSLSTTAEGIETVPQLYHLRSLGVSYGQGYLFSKALPAEDIPRWLREDLPRLHGLFQPG
ncbi:putative bifunctional diguanylate cyclase/phosphodiesterase [Chitinilyticum piscinae]|uniref:EAL domain-containing protein n=1 Tax=Chitinilyticum piscinae TaxID=2866724 RepID=A0A8J7K1T4_9NEIS|nr:EAL domain-containing protein [Chitinilyticum piscinae]MBE9609082.1 EAL domain-containing protein [Chitinilyticum piscinae]